MRALRTLLRPAVRQRRSRRTATGAPGRLWLFDLDNTLHDTSHAIFPQIDHGMTMAVAEALDVDVDTANAVRKQYWQRYGATMIGMVRNHGVDPHASCTAATTSTSTRWCAPRRRWPTSCGNCPAARCC